MAGVRCRKVSFEGLVKHPGPFCAMAARLRPWQLHAALGIAVLAVVCFTGKKSGLVYLGPFQQRG